ncbi:MAG: ceramidase domain-containing protein [Rhodomicrobium sp.]
MLHHGATIFDYCERGQDASFWAEPLNALTNGGFILAAIAGAAMMVRRPPQERSLWHAFFILNFIAIGIGSFLFHTVPNVNTVAADTGPIGLFMLSYLVFAIRRFAGVPWFLTAAALAAFIGAMVMAFNVQCWDGRIGFLLENVPAGARARCLNGSLGYGPALAAMGLIGGWLALRRHPAAPWILAAAATFAVSLTFRTLDQRLCGEWIVMGHRMGTHFLWHLFNSLTLFLLLAAAIKFGGVGHEVLPPRPKAQRPVYAV